MLFYMHVGKVPFQNPIKTNFGFRNIAAKKYEQYWKLCEKNQNFTLSPQFKDLFIKLIASAPS